VKTRTYTYDLPLDCMDAPQPGEVIRHVSLVKRLVSWFVIVDARPVESRALVNRWALTVRRTPQADVRADRIWPSSPYRPGEKP
jgi:hypothetical protein